MSRAPKQWTDNEALELHEYVSIMAKLPYHWQLVYRLLFESGARIGEVLRLTKKDLTDEGVWLKRLKKPVDRPARDLIPLPPDLILSLKRYVTLREGEILFPYTNAGAWKALKKAAAEAGVRKTMHPHLFRRGLGRRISSANLNMSLLDQALLAQRMYNHSTLRQTLIYLRPSMAEAGEMFKKLQGR